MPTPDHRPGTASRPTVAGTDRPTLAGHIRLTFDATRHQHVILAPEKVSVLNETGTAILNLCDGQRTVSEIITELRRQYGTIRDDDVQTFLSQLVSRHWMEAHRE